MPFSWPMLRNPQPTTLAAARALAHRGVQWPARAALANLAPAADDSHTALGWDPAKAALLSQPLAKDVRVGLRVGVLELVFARGSDSESFSLTTNSDAEASAWLDAKLAREGLKPASGAKLAYDMPALSFARAVDEPPRLAALAGWFAAGAEVLTELRGKYKAFKPGPSRCWPHHFDIAVAFDLGAARSIGVGLSPGDDYYAQPYFYLSPYPKPDTQGLPALPRGGRWHTHEFFGAVATAADVLALPEPAAGLMKILDAAFEECSKRLHG
jgi:hypothetical protein